MGENTQHVDETARSSSRVRAFAMVVLGLLLGAAVAISAFASRPNVPDNDFRFVWSILAVALTVTSAIVFELGLRRSSDVAQIRHVYWGRIIGVASLSVGAVALMALATLLLDLPGVSWRGLVLTVWAVAGSAPAVVALLGIHSLVRALPLVSNLGPRADEYLRLRELTLGLLPPLGALVALSTFALGAAGQLSPVAGAAPVTAGVVLAFGFIGTLLVGSVFAGPRQALRAEGRVLSRTLAPVSGLDPDKVRVELAQRQTVESQLGLNTTLLVDLQAGLFILSPLLAAATTLLVTNR